MLNTKFVAGAQTGDELQLHDVSAVKSLQCSGTEV